MQPSRPYVFFAIPTFDAKLAFECAGSLMGAAAKLTEHGVSSTVFFLPRLQFIDVARNIQVTEFLQNHDDKTHLFFIDDDVGFPSEKVVEFIARDKDVIAGVYPLKKDGNKVEFPAEVDYTNNEITEDNGLVKALHAPCGFMCIKRHVLEKLASEAETYAFYHADEGEKTIFDIFKRGPFDGKYYGEDTLFCDLVRQAGFEVWIDQHIKFSHQGTKSWTGTFANAVAQAKALKSEIDATIAAA